jgi:hypothetical protein
VRVDDLGCCYGKGNLKNGIWKEIFDVKEWGPFEGEDVFR